MKQKNQFGFSLAEIIVAMGLLSVISLGVMHLIKNMRQGQATSETKMEELELRRIIATTLTDKTACANTLVGKNIGDSITEIKNSANTVLYNTTNNYGNNTLKISSMTTQDQNPPSVFSDGSRMINLVVSFQKMKSIVKSNSSNANIAVRVVAPSANGLISSCFADANAIIQQSCLAEGGIWNGSSCTLTQFVQKIGDTMTGSLTAPQFFGDLTGNVIGNLTGNVSGNISGSTGNFTTSVSSPLFCTGANCKSINNLALSNQTCPNGQIQFGVKADGTPNCKAIQCSGNFYFAGLDSSGNTICRPYPTNTCPTNQYVSQVNADGTVVCALLPNNANSVCPSGQVLQSIIGSTPTCVNIGANQSCPAGQVITGINANGTINCANTVPANYCGWGSVVKGIAANGAIYCAQGTPTYTCTTYTQTNYCPGCYSVVAQSNQCYGWYYGSGWQSWASQTPVSSNALSLINQSSGPVYSTNGVNNCVYTTVYCYVAGYLYY